jgi:hypothetical protein
MSILHVEFDSSYKVSDTIAKLTKKEWLYILDFVEALLKTHEFKGYEEVQERDRIEYRALLERVERNADIEAGNMRALKERLEDEYEKKAAAMRTASNAKLRDLEEEHERRLTEAKASWQARLNKDKEEEIMYVSSKFEKQIKDLTEQIAKMRNLEEECEKRSAEQKAMIQSKLLKDKEEEIAYMSNKFEQQTKELKEYYNKLSNDIREEANMKQRAIERELAEKTLINDSFLQSQSMNASLQEQLEDIKKATMKGCDVVSDIRTLSQKSDEHSSKFEQITELLKPVAKFYGGSNSEKGNGGENIIRDILLTSEHYNDSIIEDVSGQTASGDIYFQWRQLKCMIEVKNKKIITKEDMSKFERDVIELSNSKRINCAMMISLQTNIFPSQTRNYIRLSIIENTPVIYSYLSHMNEIHYAISCLEQVVMSNAVANNRSIKMITYFLNYYEYMKLSQSNLEKTITNKQRELKGLFKQLDTVNKSIEGMTHDYISISSSLSQPQEENTDDDLSESSPNTKNNITSSAIEDDDDEKIEPLNLADEKQSRSTIIQIIIHRSILGKPITINDITRLFKITPSYIEKLGGHKTLVFEARDKYTSTIITKSVIEKLNSYKKENSSYPSRAFIIKNIIPDASLRKLAKVVKTKSILEYIFGFCEKL